MTKENVLDVLDVLHEKCDLIIKDERYQIILKGFLYGLVVEIIGGDLDDFVEEQGEGFSLEEMENIIEDVIETLVEDFRDFKLGDKQINLKE